MDTRPSLIYIHIPKTGGTYLNQLEDPQGSPVLSNQPEASVVYYPSLDGDSRYECPICHSEHLYFASPGQPHPLYAHHDPFRSSLTRFLDAYPNTLFFSTVRNPFSYLVSYWHHALSARIPPGHPGHYDHALAEKGFETLLKTVAEREDIWPNRRFLFCQLFHGEGQLLPAWINHQESLDEDLAQMAVHFGLKFSPKARQRVGGYGQDYRSFYTEELAGIVSHTWGRELALLGYGFDGPLPGAGAALHGLIASQTHQSLTYSWMQDCLRIDGKEAAAEDISGSVAAISLP